MVQIDHEDRHKLIKGYSHGMKNKVQMLLFLIARPPVILLDEPLTSFDVVVALEIKTFCVRSSTTMSLCSPPTFCSLPQICATRLSFCTTARLSQVDHALLQSKDFEEQIIELLTEDAPAEKKEEGANG